jgi:hypothetical protein
MLLINAITCCVRLTFLEEILTSLIASQGNLPVMIHWYLIVDRFMVPILEQQDLDTLDSVKQKATKYPNLKLIVIEHSEHTSPMNSAFSEIKDGLVCAVDDDNIMHPKFISSIYNLTKDDPIKGILYHQNLGKNPVKTNRNVRYIKIGGIKPGSVDTAQITIHRSLIGDHRWPDRPVPPNGRPFTPDGLFIQKMYQLHPDKFILHKHDICYYNYLLAPDRDFS